LLDCHRFLSRYRLGFPAHLRASEVELRPDQRASIRAISARPNPLGNPRAALSPETEPARLPSRPTILCLRTADRELESSDWQIAFA
jgi:hypothetical protein